MLVLISVGFGIVTAVWAIVYGASPAEAYLAALAGANLAATICTRGRK